MLNAHQILGVFYQCEEYARILYESLRAYNSQSVSYWYEMCGLLVSFLHVL